MCEAECVIGLSGDRNARNWTSKFSQVTDWQQKVNIQRLSTASNDIIPPFASRLGATKRLIPQIRGGSRKVYLCIRSRQTQWNAVQAAEVEVNCLELCEVSLK